MTLKHHELNDVLSLLENKFNSAFVGLTTSTNHLKEKSIEILKIAENNVADNKLNKKLVHCKQEQQNQRPYI